MSNRLLKNFKRVIARRPKADAAIQNSRLSAGFWIATAALRPRDDAIETLFNS
jgi:hypothetical protein